MRTSGFTGIPGDNAMSIRTIAKDLYRLRREVEQLEKEIRTVPVEKQEEVKTRLRKQRAELERVQRMLDGAKEKPAYRIPR
ncbi:MAG: hypothetical protein DRH37_01495 [Deltaproteobacteria bacterium]|nr:MAG: hypothetical protein DRH37_01495 [Deltaproteobacteria bacterium]